MDSFDRFNQARKVNEFLASSKKPIDTSHLTSGPPGTKPSTSNISPLANIATNNIFKKVGTNNNMPIFEAKMPDRFVPTGAQTGTPTAMDKQVSPSISPVSYKALYGEDAKQSGNVSQYRNLTDLMKANVDSLSGKIRIRDDRYPDREAFVPPGYDSDMIPFAVKISAGRLGMDPKDYMNMGLGERASHLGTEVKSMGSELGTGFSSVVDDAKGIFSNLPFWSIFGSGTTNNNTQQNVNSSNNTGVMANVQSFDPPTSSTSGQLAGMSPEMLQYYLGLSDVDKQAFLGLDNAGRMAMMKTSGNQEDQNFNFLGQYGAPPEVEATGTAARNPRYHFE